MTEIISMFIFGGFLGCFFGIVIGIKLESWFGIIKDNKRHWWDKWKKR